MSPNEIEEIGFGLAAFLYLTMALALWTRWREHPQSQVLALPVFFSAIWSSILTFSAIGYVGSVTILVIAEIGRCALWAVALILIFRTLVIDEATARSAGRWWYAIPLGTSIIGVLFLTFSTLPITVAILACVCLTSDIFLVFMSEQIYRHTPPETGSGLRYFCLSIAAIFAYDLIFWLRELIMDDRNAQFTAARGFANALLSLPIFYSVKERFNISLDSLLPRQVVFYTFSLITLSILIIAIVAGDLFIRQVGGAWSDVLRILSGIALLMLITTLMVSRSYRNKARVVMMKALFQYKYDYRREWLRFISTLSQSVPGQAVPVTAVRAIAQIVNSPGGAAWVQQQSGDPYYPIGAWNCEMPLNETIQSNSALIKFLSRRQWIIDLDELKLFPNRYGELANCGPIFADDEWWLVVPMLLGDRLSGFITLLRPKDVPVLNFEDHDILKTAGRHVATHIEQAESDRRLSEAQQFGAYNRLTAFLMHDLNNLIAQQSLVVENAKHHRQNPAFIDDAIMTISHSVDRMRRLMEQLSSASIPTAKKHVSVCGAIHTAVKRSSSRSPVPTIIRCDEDMKVKADPERLTMVIGHLLRNAQEATEDGGVVSIDARRNEDMAEIQILDSGCGMSQEFIRTRLFRPFDSTKGSQGMGIGVYQAREYIVSLGGKFFVSSEPGSGTEFRLVLPIV